MNGKSIEFLERINKEWKGYTGTKRVWPYASSEVQERIMRLGIAARVYEIENDRIQDLEMMAVATLREDEKTTLEARFGA